MHRILILTDNLKELAPWQRELVRAGYPVTTCDGDAGSLLRALMPRPPDIFVLDGTSARVSPKELRSLVAEHFPHHDARLIWLAAEEQIARLDPASGLDDFVTLPASPAEFLARVRL